MGGRDKGNVAEREVAALIKAWWAALEPKADFVRTPLSGGWGGPSIRAGFRASGDLMTTAERFPFTVEVKRREGWTMERLLKGSKSPVWGWWKQAQTQATEMNATPMLWIRKNREPWRVLVPWTVGEEARRKIVFHHAAHLSKKTFPESGDVPNFFEWEPWQLSKVDPGDLDPVMILAEVFLTVRPTVFATPARRGKSRR